MLLYIYIYKLGSPRKSEWEFESHQVLYSNLKYAHFLPVIELMIIKFVFISCQYQYLSLDNISYIQGSFNI